MFDLIIAPGPGVPEGLRIPVTDLSEQFARSAGPGGQSVNTTDSKVRLSIDLTAATAFNKAQRRRVLRYAGSNFDGPVLTVTASTHRSQLRNRKLARERMAAILREALAPPPPARKMTKPTRGSVRRRLQAKRRRSELKASRRRPERD